MQDIRSFFSANGSKKKANTNESSNKKVRKRVLDSDSDEDEKPVVKTPKRTNTSNSESRGNTSKYFKPVDKSAVNSLLGNKPVKQIKAPPKKNQVKLEGNKDYHALLDDDEDFEFINDPEELIKATPPGKVVPNSTSSEKVCSIDQNFESPKKKLRIQRSDEEITDNQKKPTKCNDVATNKIKTPSKQKDTRNHTQNISSSPEAIADVEEKSTPPVSELKSVVKETTVHSNCNNDLVNDAKVRKVEDQNAPRISASANVLPPSNLWVDKYRPTSLKQIIGQQGDKSVLNKLCVWLKNWFKVQNSGKKLQRPSPWAKDDDGGFFKAALLSGPPGVGKTTMAHLACKELGLDIVELNASNSRSKKLLNQEVGELLTTKSLHQYALGKVENASVRHVLIMDEVDGMAGNEDRGGVQELISLIKTTKVPVICMCNDRAHPKIRSLGNHCFDLKVSRPRVNQIQGAMMSICFKEGLKIKPDVLSGIIASTNQDIRLVLNHLSMLSAKHNSEMNISNKEIKLGAWDVLRKVFSDSERKTMSIHDQCDLFFHDYSIAPLFVQENYLNVQPVPEKASSKKRKMSIFAAAAKSLSVGDIIENSIRSNSAWSLLPCQAIFSTVVPGYHLSGRVSGQINFPLWFGKNSKTNRFNRISQEIQMHTRLKASGSVGDIKLDYAKALRDTIAAPLISQGSEGVTSALDVMREYSLVREDLESLNEIASWPGMKDLMSTVDSKVKAALTRLYNKSPIVTPFSLPPVKKTKNSGGENNTEGFSEMMEGDDETLSSDDEQKDDPVKDAMISVKTKKAAKGTGKNSREEPSSSKKPPSKRGRNKK